MTAPIQHDAFALVEFTCRRRNGSTAQVPPGPCVIEEGAHFAAICWRTGSRRCRAEITWADLKEHIAQGHLAYTAPWAKQA
jgi:hypothetical protein